MPVIGGLGLTLNDHNFARGFVVPEQVQAEPAYRMLGDLKGEIHS